MKKFLLKSIRWYQRNISANTPPACRFHPTCSNYAIEALEEHGVLKGGLLALYRILRCNPCCKSGIDLVPPRKVREK